jgi:uncharacterized protein
MKRIILLFLLFTGLGASAQLDLSKPNPPRLVNDRAGVLSAQEISQLEAKLVAYDDSSSVQIAVVTVRSTGDMPIEEAALKILREWGVGNKKTNNGVVLLAAMEDRKFYIATGYGLEGSIPDVLAKQIIQNEIVPSFRAGNYYEGFDKASDAIIKASAGEYKAPEGYGNRGRGGGGSFIGIIVIIIIILAILSRIGRGGGGGGMLNRSGFLPWLVINSLLNSGNRSSGWGGGSSGWGGGGGGGFGGFGGGSGGGGGAGGSW